jgi:3-oxoacyl-[acyl-carrier protein] reductase
MFGLQGRVAVVTGAASGIGRAMAEIFSAAGARVVLGDLDGEGAERAAEALRAQGGQAIGRVANVAHRVEVDALASAALSEWDRLDVFCNVAGIPTDGLLAKVSEEEFDRAMGINLKGTLFGCQAAVAAMSTRGGGSIINVSSAAIDLPVAHYGLYSMTKAAVAQLTRSLSVEVGEFGIRVNALAPGATVTNFTKRHLKNPDGTLDPERFDAFISAMEEKSPLGIVGEADDQAWLALYLATDASRFCTGQIWRANGGATFGN